MTNLLAKFEVYIFSHSRQSRLNVLGGPGPARLMGPHHPYGRRGGVGTVVLCTSEFAKTHLGPNQGQT